MAAWSLLLPWKAKLPKNLLCSFLAALTQALVLKFQMQCYFFFNLKDKIKKVSDFFSKSTSPLAPLRNKNKLTISQWLLQNFKSHTFSGFIYSMVQSFLSYQHCPRQSLSLCLKKLKLETFHVAPTQVIVARHGISTTPPTQALC